MCILLVFPNRICVLIPKTTAKDQHCSGFVSFRLELNRFYCSILMELITQRLSTGFFLFHAQLHTFYVYVLSIKFDTPSSPINLVSEQTILSYEFPFNVNNKIYVFFTQKHGNFFVLSFVRTIYIRMTTIYHSNAILIYNLSAFFLSSLWKCFNNQFFPSVYSTIIIIHHLLAINK